MKDYKIVRMNVRVPDYIRDWYKEQGEKYSVPYTNYISMLLTQIYEREEGKEAIKQLNDLMKNIKDTSGDVTVSQMLEDIKELKNLVEQEAKGNTHL